MLLLLLLLKLGQDQGIAKELAMIDAAAATTAAAA